LIKKTVGKSHKSIKKKNFFFPRKPFKFDQVEATVAVGKVHDGDVMMMHFFCKFL